ncbi:MAG: hypothetical protein WB781_08125 [Candidatus Sulfotelmatobacter sp.]
MEFPAKGASLFLLFCLVALAAASGQEERGKSNIPKRVAGEDADVQQRLNGARPLTRAQGLAIVRVAMNSRRPVRSRYDCSHFVHGLYQSAGFPYGYASSSELYAGIAEFRRVASPQAGDLAAWRGHAGIVVNPNQHSFLSVLHTGPGVDRYDSPYWKRRGRPRFFRYVEAAPSGVFSSSLRTASLRPSASNTEPHEPAEELVLDDTESRAKLAERQPVSPATLGNPVVHSALPKPEQVSAAFLQACTDLEQNLRGRDLFKSDQSLIVFDRFEVRKVHLRENASWAEVQIDELVSFAGSETNVRKRSERQRWPLSRRGNTSWELTPSPNTLYLPQQVAVRILAHELAQLTDDSVETVSENQEKAELARALNALIGK